VQISPPKNFKSTVRLGAHSQAGFRRSVVEGNRARLGADTPVRVVRNQQIAHRCPGSRSVRPDGRRGAVMRTLDSIMQPIIVFSPALRAARNASCAPLMPPVLGQLHVHGVIALAQRSTSRTDRYDSSAMSGSGDRFFNQIRVLRARSPPAWAARQIQCGAVRGPSPLDFSQRLLFRPPASIGHRRGPSSFGAASRKRPDSACRRTADLSLSTAYCAAARTFRRMTYRFVDPDAE